MNTSKYTLFLITFIFMFACNETANLSAQVDINTAAILKEADLYLQQAPTPITYFPAERSLGSLHDFYSEGDYWWPNPDDPDGPYIRRDGESNPDNFNAHREAMRDLSRWVASLVAAYKITKEEKRPFFQLANCTNTKK